MSADCPAGEATARKAARFFWAWLIAATSVSVAGNVAHAVLSAPSGRLQLAAAAAVVPPAVLLGATHSVALLVRTRRGGFSYWCALAMTVALAGCAFVLSFDALRELATTLGMPGDRAWLWPVAIDVSIANSTVSLLSLTPPLAHRDSVIRGGAGPRTAPEVLADAGVCTARDASGWAGDDGVGVAHGDAVTVSPSPSPAGAGPYRGGSVWGDSGAAAVAAGC